MDKSSSLDARHFFQFVTRPDIQAPRWSVTIYDEYALAPGLLFAATYENLEQGEQDNRAWVGPHIYDQRGELVWSGAPMFRGYNVKDFKLSNVDGVDMLTGIYGRENYDVIMNNSYQIHKRLAPESGSTVNIHAFTTVENGTRSLAMTDQVFDVPDNAGGLKKCNVYFQGFEERDTKSWQATFVWNAYGHIRLDETFIEPHCPGVGDFLHANSIDKFPDGDYLFSGRHTDTLYKISGKDGSIVWRLGGQYSDFAFSGYFSGQHDAQVRSQNRTHTVISLVDNASRPGSSRGTSDQSRGLVILLRTDTRPMTGSITKSYSHPRAALVAGRCNFQTLGNENAFLAWWKHSLVTEYSPEGDLVMQASWLPMLNSYRTYKFRWIGQPVQPPDTYAELQASPKHFRTAVYVSWNGATEVESWTLYKASADGQVKERVLSAKRTGFETSLMYEGWLSHVILEAVDGQGNILGKSQTFKTIIPEAFDLTADDLDGLTLTRSPKGALSYHNVTTSTFGSCIIILMVIAFVWRVGGRKRLRMLPLQAPFMFGRRRS